MEASEELEVINTEAERREAEDLFRSIEMRVDSRRGAAMTNEENAMSAINQDTLLDTVHETELLIRRLKKETCMKTHMYGMIE